MKATIQHETLGEIVYDENYWTGKKKLFQNGTELTKVDKRTFTAANGEQLSVKGGFLFGAILLYGGQAIQLTPKIKWYEIVLSLLPLMLFLIWGNVVELCKIVPIVGGALGGAIGGIMFALEIYFIRAVKPIWLKLIIALVIFGAAFGIGAGLGYAIVDALT